MKTLVLPLKLIHVISIKILTIYFVDIDKLILKFIWNCKKEKIAKTIVKTKEGFKHLDLILGLVFKGAVLKMA